MSFIIVLSTSENEYLPIPVPEMLNCDAFIPRPFLDTSPKSHPSPYLKKDMTKKMEINKNTIMSKWRPR